MHIDLLQTESGSQINNFIKIKSSNFTLQKSKLDLLGKSLLWIRERKHSLVSSDQTVVQAAHGNNPSPEGLKTGAGAVTHQRLARCKARILITVSHLLICPFDQEVTWVKE